MRNTLKQDNAKSESQVEITKDDQTGLPHMNRAWSRKRKLGILSCVALLVVCLAIGLGVGLTQRNKNQSDEDNDTSSPSNSNNMFNNTSNNTGVGGLWKPQAGLSWNYQINGALNLNSTTTKFNVWDLDMIENSRDTFTSIQNQGSSVICYFSAGSYENWRPDASNFTKSDYGKDLAGWPGEKWLNVSSPNVRNIMLSRLDLAVQKSCNGVDPDNVDGYNNDNGLGLTKQNAIDYVLFLAEAAHVRNLSIGLKNAGEIIPQVINQVDYSVNEQCVQYNECAKFSPFILQNKPVFHVEYPKGAGKNDNNPVSAAAKTIACASSGVLGFSTIIKNMNLDSWIQFC